MSVSADLFRGLVQIKRHACLGPAIRGVAVLLTVALATSTPKAQVLTGKTPFWQALEAKTAQKFVAVGSSMSQTKNSFWPSLLAQALTKRFGSIATWGEVAWQGENSEFCLYGGAPYHPDPMITNVLGSKANAVTIEFAMADCDPDSKISVARHKQNMAEIIRRVRAKFPGVTVILYQTGLLPPNKIARNPDYPLYIKATGEVAAEQKTYLCNTYDKFKTIYDHYVKAGKEAQYWADYQREPTDHHPSARAASEVIVPAMLAVLQGTAAVKLPPIWLATLPASKYYTGEKVPLSWTYDTDSVSNIVLEVSLDSGKTYRSIYSGPASARTFTWTVPATIDGLPCVSNKAYFRIKDSDGSPQSSTGPIILSNATPSAAVTIGALAKTVYRVGDTLKIAWTYDTTKMDAVKVDFSTNNGLGYHSFLSSAVQGKSLSWVIPPAVDDVSVITAQAIIRIQDYNEIYTAKTPVFSIVASTALVRRYGTIRNAGSELGRPEGILFSISGQIIGRTGNNQRSLQSGLLVVGRPGTKSALLFVPDIGPADRRGRASRLTPGSPD